MINHRFNMKEVTQAKTLLSRIDTYDALTKFELQNPDLVYNEELENASSDNEPYLLQDKIDVKKLQQARDLQTAYDEAVKATQFCAPLIRPPPTTMGRSTLEDVIDEAKYQAETQDLNSSLDNLFEEKLQQAFTKTITLPAECLPPQLLQKVKAKELPPPRRLMRSQLDPVFQASSQVEKPDEIEQSTQSLLKSRVNNLEKTTVKEYTPSKYQQTLNKRYEEEWKAKVQQGKQKDAIAQMERKLATQANISQIINDTRARQPKITSKSFLIGDLMRLDKKVKQIENTPNLIKGYDMFQNTDK